MAKKSSANYPAPHSVTTIQLDPKNPRLPKKSTPYTQTEIIEELVNNNEVYKIAKSIKEKGFFFLENIICIKHTDGKTYVMEGNRRICACKLLLNPKLAPVKNQKKFESLAKNFDLESIKRLPVVMVAKRAEAYPMMVSKHTKSLTKDWEPIMQAQFYLNVLDEGNTLEEASELLGVTPGEIKSAISLLDLYSAAREIDTTNEISKSIKDPHKFELSTFKRVLTNKKVTEAFDIQIDDEGKVNVGINEDEFKNAFAKIVSDIASGEKDSRSLNTTKDIEGYINTLKSEGYLPKNPTKAKNSKKLGFIYKPTNTATPLIVADVKPIVKKATTTLKRKGLVTSDVKCDHVDKIGDVFKELKKISPLTCPNSCAMTLRMLIELSTYEFLKQSGEYKKLQTILAGSTGDPKKMKSLELKAMLTHIIKNNLLNDTQLTKALQAFVTDESTKPILTALNQFVHNIHWKANEQKLFNIWDDIKDYLKIVLQK